MLEPAFLRQSFGVKAALPVAVNPAGAADMDAFSHGNRIVRASFRSQPRIERRVAGSMLRTFGTIVVTAVLVSAFWIFFYNIRNGAQIDLAGQKTIIDPAQAPPVTIAEGVVVGPAGL